jgi:hypothetical protein
MLTILFSSNYLYSQGNNWKLDGNSNSGNASFLGTTNSFPLQFRTNNQNRFTIGSTGNYTFHTLSGNSNALMLLNNNGEAYRLNFSQNNNDILTGNGTWQSINTLVPQYWQQSNSGLYTSQAVVVNNTITATGIHILHRIEADTIKGVRKVDINGNITLGEDGAYKGITAKIEDLNINSKPGFDFNTILNANTNGNVGIGTSNPSKKLDVNGDARVSGALSANTIEAQIFQTDTIKVGRILPSLIDTLIHFGDSSITLDPNRNLIKWSPGAVIGNIFNPSTWEFFMGLGFGNGNTFAKSSNSMAIGTNVSINDYNTLNSIVMGSGISSQNRLVNNIPNSMMIGFNSNIPTLFISPSNGINTSGYVGIGTINPSEKLTIQGVQAKLKVGELNNHVIVGYNGGNSIIESNGTGQLLINYYSGKNVAIGGGPGGAAKLYVAGNIESGQTIKACRVEVETTSWCDYVFDEKYSLMSLTEVNQFIKKNKHLPDMPSEKEILQNNIDVAEMLKMQQRKIEELMLYVIELEKKINENK